MVNAMGTTHLLVNSQGYKVIGVRASVFATGDTLDLDAGNASVATIIGVINGTGTSQVATTPLYHFASNRITFSSVGTSGVFLIVFGA